MPKKVDVMLRVISRRPRAERGFRQATDGNNTLAPFFYKFKGGKDDMGDVVADKKADELKVVVKLDNKTINGGYSIMRAEYKLGSEQSPDIVFPTPRKGKSVRIIDKALDDGIDVFYNIVVKKDGKDVEIVCDPRISNRFN